ncbi:hypothetical protein ACOMHN_016213 [Nucella lapillus]
MSANDDQAKSKAVVYWGLNNYGVSALEIVINCVLVILAAWIILLNSLVFDTLIRYGRKRGAERKPTDCLVASLSLADMVTGVFLIYNTVYNLTNFQIRVECLVRNAFLITTMISSVLHLALLTTDRYVQIILPYRYDRVCNQVTVLVLALFTWITALMLALLPTFGWSNTPVAGDGKEGEGETTTTTATPTPVCSFFGLMHPDYLRFVVCLFFVPFLLMGILYGHIFKVARRHSREIAAQERACRRRDRHTWKFTKTVLIVMGLYFLSWLPVGTVILLHLEGNLNNYTLIERGTLLLYCSATAFASSIINPVIYAVKITAVRARFAAIFCRGRKIAIQTDISMTRASVPPTAHAWVADKVKAKSRCRTLDGESGF